MRIKRVSSCTESTYGIRASAFSTPCASLRCDSSVRHKLCITRAADPKNEGETLITEFDGKRQVAWVRVDGHVYTTEQSHGEDSESGTRETPLTRARLYVAGYPETLTPDYLRYQLWTLPVHITGWITNSLATSTLLKAAGIGSSAAGAVAAGAAIKWITKDGIGAFGRVLVGGSLARFFDEDPRYWRFLGDLVKCFGQALEVATVLYPNLFVLLAGTGNFAKAAGKGISRPSFRVIQNHFAKGSNVGDIAAKEEVWEVAGQLIGLAASVAVLEGLDSSQVAAQNPAAAVISVWVLAQASHIILRYKALATLELPWISQSRAIALCKAFVNGQALPNVRQLCSVENFALPKQVLRPRIITNVGLMDLEAAAERVPSRLTRKYCQDPGRFSRSLNENRRGPGPNQENGVIDTSRSKVSAVCSESTAQAAILRLITMYHLQGYVLLLNSNEEFLMSVLRSCEKSPVNKLQAVLQAVWFEDNRLAFPAGIDGEFQALEASLEYARTNFDEFQAQLEDQGWRLHDILMISHSKAVLEIKP